MIIFLDLETTGLDPERCAILEVAAVAYWAPTGPCMTFPHNMPRFESVIFARGEDLAAMDPYVLKMHASSGLLDACQQPSAPDLDAVTDGLIKWLASLCQPSPCFYSDAAQQLTLAGNSIHFDRSFLRRHMHVVSSMFHYRMLDVSALHLAADAFGKPRAERPAQVAHRAMADVLDSIRQFEFYRG